ncbi:MAG TPA: lytic transglycosylase domain-containing protein [Armatimonadota bacterium]|jgi:soluble lytic murein transglycosylase-like protein
MIEGLDHLINRVTWIEGRLAALQGPSYAGAAAPAPPEAAAPADETFAAALRRAGSGAPAGRPAAARAYNDLVQTAAARHGVDPDLVHAVIQAESDYNPRCHSSAGAMGLMQLMPENARDAGLTDPYDPAQNIEGGVQELSGYLRRYHGDVRLSLAAYNAGPGAVHRYGGIPPYRETQAYVPRVLRYLEEIKHGNS